MLQQWEPAPHVTVFIRNLQLLNLHERPDAPKITAELFADTQPRTARQRVKAVEWALYNLLLIYDPNDATQSKLRPHWPPLETLQSVNLRAALLRVLADLKKNGAFGRDVVLRKTMLDECKGEKVEELLAVVSTATLKKALLKGRSHARDNISEALRIALCDHFSSADGEKLVPMILAHCSSLHKILRERKGLAYADARTRGLLSDKDAELDVREHKCQSIPFTELDLPDAQAAKESFLSSWKGKDVWATAFLDGGLSAGTDEILDATFEDIWGQARNAASQRASSSSSFLHGPSKNLVVDLDSRLSEQRSRLQYWKEFKLSLPLQRPSPSRKSANDNNHRNKTALFRRHQDLYVAAISKSSSIATGSPVQRTHHASLIASLDEALLKDESATRKGKPFTPHQAQAKGARAHLASYVSSPISPLPRRPTLNWATPSRTASPHQFPNLSPLSASRLEFPVPDSTERTLGFTDDAGNTSAMTDWEDASSAGIKSSPSVAQNTSDWENLNDDDSHISRSVTPTERRFVTNENPLLKSSSPASSLVDRHGEITVAITPCDNDKALCSPDEQPSTPHVDTSLNDQWQDESLNPDITPSKKQQHHHLSSNSPPSFAGRISIPRPLLSPAVEDHNIPPPGPPPLTPREELFSQAADYASVFKSRPKVKSSPFLSPSP